MTSAEKQTPDSCTAPGGRGGSGDYVNSLPGFRAELKPRSMAALMRAASPGRFTGFMVADPSDLQRGLSPVPLGS